MARYVTRRTPFQPPRRPDTRPFVPMRPGGFSPLDLPVWVGALAGSTWIAHHIHSAWVGLGLLGGFGVVCAIVVSMIRLRLHARRSRPMISTSDDQPFA